MHTKAKGTQGPDWAGEGHEPQQQAASGASAEPGRRSKVEESAGGDDKSTGWRGRGCAGEREMPTLSLSLFSFPSICDNIHNARHAQGQIRGLAGTGAAWKKLVDSLRSPTLASCVMRLSCSGSIRHAAQAPEAGRWRSRSRGRALVQQEWELTMLMRLRLRAHRPQDHRSHERTLMRRARLARDARSQGDTGRRHNRTRC